MTQMRDLDPVAELVGDLRQLRCASGAPSYAQLAKASGIPRSTLYDAFRGDRMPSLEVTLAVVRACDGDEDAWHKRWTSVRHGLDSPSEPPPNAAGRTPDVGGHAPDSGRRFLRKTVLIPAALVTALIAAAAIGFASHRSSGCLPVREYRAEANGAILDGDGAVVGKVQTGDLIDVPSLAHDKYPHRYNATVHGTTLRGYVDESKLHYLHDACVPV
jgi:hypothetical protein